MISLLSEEGMNEFQRIKQLEDKMHHLIETVGRNGGRFSSIDKDLLVGYVREFYELTVSIQPGVNPPPSIQPIVTNGKEIPQPEQPLTEESREHNGEHSENGMKKSITEIYAKNGAEKSSVNDRFKKQTPEVADKLRQTPIKDLKAYIGLNKRFAFIETLFNDREQEYEDALTRVNNFKSYEEAVNYLRGDVLPKYEWNDEEPLVNEFFTLVMRRYLK
ncbi:MAG: hypothetical protein K1X63_15480 [Chitinophagales bacterium]|nr:hypothetical protein [Chitinophagales bacterium]